MASDALTLRPNEAARMLSVGRTFFREKVLPELATIKRGSVLLIPLAELHRWVERQAVISSGGETNAGGRSGSATKARGRNSRQASKTSGPEPTLRELVALYSQRRSAASGSNVVPLRQVANRSGRSPRNG